MVLDRRQFSAGLLGMATGLLVPRAAEAAPNQLVAIGAPKPFGFWIFDQMRFSAHGGFYVSRTRTVGSKNYHSVEKYNNYGSKIFETNQTLCYYSPSSSHEIDKYSTISAYCTYDPINDASGHVVLQKIGRNGAIEQRYTVFKPRLGVTLTYFPRIARSLSGEFLLSWIEFSDDFESIQRIWNMRLDRSGSPRGLPTYTGGSGYRAMYYATVPHPQGGYWQVSGSGKKDGLTQVRVTRLNAEGRQVGERIVLDRLPYNQHTRVVADLSDTGSLFVAWSARDHENNLNINSVRISPGGLVRTNQQIPLGELRFASGSLELAKSIDNKMILVMNLYRSINDMDVECSTFGIVIDRKGTIINQRIEFSKSNGLESEVILGFGRLSNGRYMLAHYSARLPEPLARLQTYVLT